MKYRIAAVIAAAGLSSRMGRFKPLLPFGDRTAVEIVTAAFADNGVTPIIVVGGHRIDDLKKIVTGTAARCTYNPDYRQGMFSSFKHGFGALPGGIHAVFAHPVDIPLISSRIVRQMLKAFEKQPDSVIYPSYRGNPGRPVLIPTDLIEDIQQSGDQGGLRNVLQTYEDRFRLIEVNHQGILWDMDNIEDYRRLKAIYEKTPL